VVETVPVLFTTVWIEHFRFAESDSMAAPTTCKPKATPTVLFVVSMWLGIAASSFVLALLIPYVWSHDSNHTGFDPWMLLAAFAPTAILGFVAFRRRANFLGAILACVVGLGGIGYLVYLDRTNRLLQYETWIERGMP
jgi:hypothetical protein